MTPGSNEFPEVAAIVLAAGRSSRMAPHNKLLLRDAAGLPMVARVVGACCASLAASVLVVTGHDGPRVADAVGQAVRSPKLRIVSAPDYALGMAASLRAGLLGLPATSAAALICLGDMPGVSAGLIDRLILAYAAARPCAVVPVWDGRRGHPVLWDRRCFADLQALQGDRGGRNLLHRPGLAVMAVAADGPGVLADYDRREAAEAAGFYVTTAGAAR